MLAYVLDHSDPVHKVTILPTGMALGVTQQLPTEERHIYKKEYIADSIVVALGGRIAEDIVFGHVSTGAQNDLVRITEMARRMVREWGMSERIGPMAWGSQGPVFLGEDLVHTRDYSDETARVIDEEVERILRQEEARARRVLRLHRRGLDALAKALLEHETLDGDEVARIVDDAMGRKAGGYRKVRKADGTIMEVKAPTAENGNRRSKKAAAKRADRATRNRLVEVADRRFRSRAGGAEFGDGGPQIGGGGRADERAADDALVVGDQDHRDRADLVALVEIAPLRSRRARTRTRPATRAPRPSDPTPARVAQRRREVRDEPRRVRPREVGPVELARDRVGVARRRRRTTRRSRAAITSTTASSPTPMTIRRDHVRSPSRGDEYPSRSTRRRR